MSKNEPTRVDEYPDKLHAYAAGKKAGRAAERERVGCGNPDHLDGECYYEGYEDGIATERARVVRMTAPLRTIHLDLIELADNLASGDPNRQPSADDGGESIIRGNAGALIGVLDALGRGEVGDE